MTRALTRLAVLFVLVCLLGLMISRQYYIRNRPAAPQPELGRTIAVELNHNKTVYVTPVENFSEIEARKAKNLPPRAVCLHAVMPSSISPLLTLLLVCSVPLRADGP